MDRANMARILQNMIEEAEENLASVAERMRGYEHLEHLDERRADIDEAIALVEELGGAPLHTVEEWKAHAVLRPESAEPSPGYYKMYLDEQSHAERADGEAKALRAAPRLPYKEN